MRCSAAGRATCPSFFRASSSMKLTHLAGLRRVARRSSRTCTQRCSFGRGLKSMYVYHPRYMWWSSKYNWTNAIPSVCACSATFCVRVWLRRRSRKSSSRKALRHDRHALSCGEATWSLQAASTVRSHPSMAVIWAALQWHSTYSEVERIPIKSFFSTNCRGKAAPHASRSWAPADEMRFCKSEPGNGPSRRRSKMQSVDPTTSRPRPRCTRCIRSSCVFWSSCSPWICRRLGGDCGCRL